MKIYRYLIFVFIMLVTAEMQAQQQVVFDEEKVFLQYQQQMSSGETQKAFNTLANWYKNTNKILPAMLLAEAYQTGIGTKVNIEQALILYKSVSDSQIPDDNEESKLIVSACSRQYGILKMVHAGDATSESISYLRQSVSLTEDAMALTILGMLFLDEKKEDGIKYLARAAERNSIIALELLGEISASHEEMDQAIAYWEKAATTPIYYVAREEQHNSKLSFLVNPNLDINSAVIEYQREACIKLASIYYEMEEYTATTALSWLSKIVQDDDRSLSLKAFCYARVGKMDDTRAIFMDLYNRTNDAEYLTNLGITEFYHGNKESSKKYLQKAMSEGSQEAKESYAEFFNNQ